jgi:hypothetical protein
VPKHYHTDKIALKTDLPESFLTGYASERHDQFYSKHPTARPRLDVHYYFNMAIPAVILGYLGLLTASGAVLSHMHYHKPVQVVYREVVRNYEPKMASMSHMDMNMDGVPDMIVEDKGGHKTTLFGMWKSDNQGNSELVFVPAEELSKQKAQK